MQNTSLAFITGDLTSLEEAALQVQEDRPFATEDELTQLGFAIMTEVLDVFSKTGLEAHLPTICDGVIGGFHTMAMRLDREADRQRDQIRQLDRNFDGSEIMDTELQEATEKARLADIAQRSVELVRDAAADACQVATGHAWTPWKGSVRANRVTAAVVQARDVVVAAKAAKANLLPEGCQIVAFRAAKGTRAELDANRVFDALNWARAQFANMALITSDNEGAERLATSWAKQMRVPLIVERASPLFDRFGRRTPFVINDRMLELKPVLCLTLGKSLAAPVEVERAGQVLNLGQKAKAAGILHFEITA